MADSKNTFDSTVESLFKGMESFVTMYPSVWQQGQRMMTRKITEEAEWEARCRLVPF